MDWVLIRRTDNLGAVCTKFVVVHFEVVVLLRPRNLYRLEAVECTKTGI